MRLILIVVAAILWPAPTVAEAATHAIVIGINNYAHHPHLMGAVNDAKDIADALRPDIDGSFQLLIDTEATRANFDAAWNKVTNEAKPGDLLIFSYSGHGVTDTDDDAYRDEADGLDEFLVMQPAKINPTGDDVREYVRDDELYWMFLDAKRRQIQILFIADACHAGGLARQVSSETIAKGGLPYRFTQFKTKPVMPAAVASDFRPKPEVSDNVIFVSATTEKQRLQEMLFNRKPHGALSYYAARAFEGAADANGDGILSAEEFKDFVIPMVVSAAGDRQIPELEGANLERKIVQVPKHEFPKSMVDLPRISLAVDGASAGDLHLQGVDPISQSQGASLVWRMQDAALFNATGDRLSSAVSVDNIQMAIDAARVRAGLLAVDEKGAQLSVRLTPDDRLYGPGCFVRFSAQSKRFPYYTALNLSASGAIQFLFPLKKFNDPIKWINPKAWSIKSKTGKPFGADFLIFIASESPLSALHTLLASRGPTLEPAVFYQALASELGGMRFEIGFKGVYTSPKGEACED